MGIAWDLLWAAVILGIAFVVGHALFVWRVAPRPSDSGTAAGGDAPPGIPERVVRHTVSSRVFHWLMSLTMFALLITAFFPVIGIRFPWVTIHWIAGVGLIATVVYHVIHAAYRRSLTSMWIDRGDLSEGSRGMMRFLKRDGSPPAKAGKYPVDHKLYHHATAAVSAVAILTGILMMFRVETPLWVRNPYLLADQTWGFVYVLHGLSGVALVTMVMAHVYFAIRPEKWWLTRSMIKGWIYRKEYLANHDPKQWVVTPGAQRPAVQVGAPGPHSKQPVR
jgi:cytochrome b subunit of formate dehydrogenase